MGGQPARGKLEMQQEIFDTNNTDDTKIQSLIRDIRAIRVRIWLR